MTQNDILPAYEQPMDDLEKRRRLAACYRLLLSIGPGRAADAAQDGDEDDSSVKLTVQEQATR